MTPAGNTALGLSRVLLRVLVVWNAFWGVAFLAAFGASFVFEGAAAQFLQTRLPELGAAVLSPTMRAMMLVVAALAAVMHVMLSRLLEIVGAVRLGQPFAAENAVRLRTIAWCLLLVQLLNLAFGAIVKVAATANVQIDWDFSLAGWIAVLLVFVLARVFEEGARIRDELEAMI